jgi:hypothetical protein
METENEDKKAKDKNLPKNNEVIEDGAKIVAPKGAGYETGEMTHNIENWIYVMEHDMEYQEAKDSIPRITSEQMNILKNKNGKENKESLENLNKILKLTEERLKLKMKKRKP